MKKLTNADRIDIALRLAAMDRNVIIGVCEVAVLHNTTVGRIYQASSPAAVARGTVTLQLPEKVKCNGRRAGWLHGQVRDMIGTCETRLTIGADKSRSPADRKGRNGRPRQV